ncbi:MAG: DUF4037 domain-containing protein, partial [bacterium]
GMEEVDKPPINHWIQIETANSFVNNDVIWNPVRPPTLHEWLTFPDQALSELTSGRIFHDDLGEITEIRKWLQFFPDSVWFFKMYCLWAAIAEEDAFVGRCNHVNDLIGEKLILTRIIGKLMRLCFLLERRYYPYSKWFGTAFSKLEKSSKLMPIINNALSGNSYEIRNENLCRFYQEIGKLHNELCITDKIDTKLIQYHGRPYKGMDPEPFFKALKELFEKELKDYNFTILSKTVLYDESCYGSYKSEMKAIVDASRIL